MMQKTIQPTSLGRFRLFPSRRGCWAIPAAILIMAAPFWTPLAAGDAADPGIDLLAGPLGSAQPYAWKHFSEDPQSPLEAIWQLREGVLTCRGTPKGYLYLDHASWTAPTGPGSRAPHRT